MATNINSAYRIKAILESVKVNSESLHVHEIWAK